MDVSSKPLVKGRRPLGVWILTGYAVLFASLAPAASVVIVFAVGEAQAVGLGTADLLFSLLLGIGVTIAAIGAWRGNSKARVALVVLVTIHYVLIALNNWLLLDSGSVPDWQQVRIWGRVLRGIVYPAIYIWYFWRRETKEYYEDMKQRRMG